MQKMASHQVRSYALDDNPKIFAGRPQIREYIIHVSNELTVRKRAKLNALKLRGKTGYIYQGQLVVKSSRPIRDKTDGRIILSATRRLTQQTALEKTNRTTYTQDKME